MANHNADPATTETIIRIKHAAEKALTIAGVVAEDGSIKSATLGIEYSALTEHPEKALPTLKVTKAVGEFASKAHWDYTISIGAQDAEASRYALFTKDTSKHPEISYYDGRPTRPMNELEALAIATDMERIAESDPTA